MSRPPATVAWLLGGLWAGMPLYPAFIALLPITPPGYSLIGAGTAVAILGYVGLLSFLVARALWLAFGWRLASGQFTQAMAVYLGSMALAGTLGFVPVVGFLFSVITLCSCIGTIAVLRFGSDPKVARAMRLSLLISSAVASVLALVCWLSRAPAQLYAVGNGRAIGTFVVPGELAGYLGMLLPYTVGVALTVTSPKTRMLAIVAATVNCLAAIATFSRAGLLGLCVAFCVAVALLRPRLIPWLVGGALLVSTQLHRVINVHHNPAENFNRLSIWHAALRTVQLFPLWGVGPGGFARIYPFVKLPGGEPLAYHAHSLLLTTAAETGLIGLCGLATLWLTFLVQFRRRYQAAEAKARLVGTAILAGFIATWVQSCVDVVQILFLGLWIPFMGMALLALEEGS